MPLGNYYIRYVDDFIILHNSKQQLNEWKEQINNFLKESLKLELHPDKSRILSLSRGVDFVGFRNFYNFKLLRKRNIRKMIRKIELYNNRKINFGKIFDSYSGWKSYSVWASSYKLREQVKMKIIDILLESV